MQASRPLILHFPRNLTRGLASILLLVALLGASWGQEQNPTPPTPVPGAGISVQDQQKPATQAQPQPAAEEPPQQPITKAQAKELFRSVDEILQFASQDTGLPIKHKVKRKLITRQAVQRYLEKHIKEDKDTQRIERSEAVLKKFGLLPPEYNMHTEFLKLMGEQVAAYYDSGKKTVYLLDWVQPDIQKPVLAHELTHALQDQKVGLEKWGLAGAKDDRPQPDQQEQVVEEEQAARQAVTEGQAMIVLLDYSLAPLGKSVATDPDAVDIMRSGMGDSKDSPVFAASPVFLRESMLMPYTFGMDFVREVLVKKGKEAAFTGLLEHPPVSTRQIMQPETYLANEAVEPLLIPDLDKLVAPNYQRYDFGEIGEFDVYLLLKQYAPSEDLKKIYPHWRGGYYLAVRAKDAPKDQIGLLYFSRWDSPEAAESFKKIYLDYVPKRYPKAYEHGVPGGGGGGIGGVCSDSWMQTGQGRVAAEQCGKDLLITESLDETTTQRIRDALLFGKPLAQGEKAASAH